MPPPCKPSDTCVFGDYRKERDIELQHRINAHTNMMQDRRRQPKGTPQEEMEAAKRELQIVSVHTYYQQNSSIIM